LASFFSVHKLQEQQCCSSQYYDEPDNKSPIVTQTDLTDSTDNLEERATYVKKEDTCAYSHDKPEDN